MFATASLLTSFVAGVVALFAPCCIGFLLPSYLGTIFHQRRRVLLLTAVFGLGIFTIFLPIGLSIGAVGAFLQRFHNVFFYGGAATLVALGGALALGYIPMLHVASPRMRRASVGGIYGLGVMSGIGSACCAPVFAGVAALSVLSASALGGAVLAGVYVLGMVAPLFVLSWMLDRTKLISKMTVLQKPVAMCAGPLRRDVTVGHVVAGTIFMIAGILVAWLTAQGLGMDAVVWRDSVQTGWVGALERTAPWLFRVPNWAWLTVFIAAIGMIVLAIKRSDTDASPSNTAKRDSESSHQPPACH